MSPTNRRLALLVASLPAAILTTALLYWLGMSALEADPRTFRRSLQWAIETLTTTGYGDDGSWTHPLMIAFVGVTQFLGVFLVFLVFPIYLLPFLEERFQARIPSQTKPISDHVLVVHSSTSIRPLLELCEEESVAVLVAESNEAKARALLESGIPVVGGELFGGLLERASLSTARAVVTNGSDAENVATCLETRALGFDGPLLALVEDPVHHATTLAAGATEALTPKHALGMALAARASTKVGLGEDSLLESLNAPGGLCIRQVRVHPGSELAGQTLRQAGETSPLGVAVLGEWLGGHLTRPMTAAATLEPHALLLVAGCEERLQAFERRSSAGVDLRAGGPVLIAGLGEVGHTVAVALEAHGEPIRTTDIRPEANADFVGNIYDAETLRELDLEHARSVVLALDSDEDTLFATVALRSRDPGLPLIARVGDAKNTGRVYEAGADFVLSLGQVTSAHLARRLLGTEMIDVAADLQITGVQLSDLGVDRDADRSIESLQIRERTGASIIGVLRNGTVLADIAPEVVVRGSDALYLAGHHEAVERARSLSV